MTTKDIAVASTQREPDQEIVDRLVELAAESPYVRELIEWANDKLCA